MNDKDNSLSILDSPVPSPSASRPSKSSIDIEDVIKRIKESQNKTVNLEEINQRVSERVKTELAKERTPIERKLGILLWQSVGRSTRHLYWPGLDVVSAGRTVHRRQNQTEQLWAADHVPAGRQFTYQNCVELISVDKELHRCRQDVFGPTASVGQAGRRFPLCSKFWSTTALNWNCWRHTYIDTRMSRSNLDIDLLSDRVQMQAIRWRQKNLICKPASLKC